MSDFVRLSTPTQASTFSPQKSRTTCPPERQILQNLTSRRKPGCHALSHFVTHCHALSHFFRADVTLCHAQVTLFPEKFYIARHTREQREKATQASTFLQGKNGTARPPERQILQSLTSRKKAGCHTLSHIVTHCHTFHKPMSHFVTLLREAENVYTEVHFLEKAQANQYTVNKHITVYKFSVQSIFAFANRPERRYLPYLCK